MGFGMLPQPIPAFSSMCLDPRSASRQVLGLTTAKSVRFRQRRPVREHKLNMVADLAGLALSRLGERVSRRRDGHQRTSPIPMRSMPAMPAKPGKGPLTPTVAVRSSTSCMTAPRAST